MFVSRKKWEHTYVVFVILTKNYLQLLVSCERCPNLIGITAKGSTCTTVVVLKRAMDDCMCAGPPECPIKVLKRASRLLLSPQLTGRVSISPRVRRALRRRAHHGNFAKRPSPSLEINLRYKRITPAGHSQTLTPLPPLISLLSLYPLCAAAGRRSRSPPRAPPCLPPP
jgi:hypothetical protein